MPELPEVQTTVDGIHRSIRGLRIVDTWTNYGGTIHRGKDNIKDPAFFKKFKKEIVGKKILGAKRRAKNILIFLEGNLVMLIHMKMTGHLLYGTYKHDKTETKDPWRAQDPGPLQDPFNRHIRFVLTLSNNKHLALSDMRKFAKITLIKTQNLKTSPHLKDLGPEPLDRMFTLTTLIEILSRRSNRPIKQVLMEPKIISGIGNIYSDEILWHSGIHPLRKIKNIQKHEYKKMFEAIQTTLKRGIDFGGDSMSDYRNIKGERGIFQEKHNVYRRTGKPCNKKGCGGIISRMIIGGRSAHFCHLCQK